MKTIARIIKQTTLRQFIGDLIGIACIVAMTTALPFILTIIFGE